MLIAFLGCFWSSEGRVVFEIAVNNGVFSHTDWHFLLGGTRRYIQGRYGMRDLRPGIYSWGAVVFLPADGFLFPGRTKFFFLLCPVSWA